MADTLIVLQFGQYVQLTNSAIAGATVDFLQVKLVLLDEVHLATHHELILFDSQVRDNGISLWSGMQTLAVTYEGLTFQNLVFKGFAFTIHIPQELESRITISDVMGP